MGTQTISDAETILIRGPGRMDTDHRANLLNPNYRDVGIGLVQGTYRGIPAIFVTEDFGRPTATEAVETDRWFV